MTNDLFFFVIDNDYFISKFLDPFHSIMERQKTVMEIVRVKKEVATNKLIPATSTITERRSDEFTKTLYGFRWLFERFLPHGEATSDWEEMLSAYRSRIRQYNSLSMPSDSVMTEMLGKIVVVKLNDGSTTRGGAAGTKLNQICKAEAGFTSLDIQLLQIECLNNQYGCKIPLVLMNSFDTHKHMHQILQKYSNINVPIHSFQQSEYLTISRGNGHGDLYQALNNSGLLERFLWQGKKYLFVSNLDNLGATIDLKILNFLFTKQNDGEGHEFLMEFNNHAKRKILKKYNLWIDLSAVQRLVQSTPLRVAFIETEKELNIKLQTAFGEAVKFFKNSVGCYVSQSRLLPAKTSLILSRILTALSMRRKRAPRICLDRFYSIVHKLQLPDEFLFHVKSKLEQHHIDTIPMKISCPEEWPSMDASIGRSLFQKRNGTIDWRKLAAVDVERIAREVDVDAIQENILNVTYCNVEHELGYHGLDANVIKLFRLAQLTIEYLLHSQEFLQQCLSERDKKIDSYNEQLNLSVQQCNGVKEDLVKRNESYKNLKKELQHSKKLIGEYQVMIRAGAGGLHKCSACRKSFVSDYYLRCHLERRHPEIAKLQPASVAQTTNAHDETVQNELDEIKARLKATEDELKREHENVYQLTLRENDRKQEFAEIFKQNEAWKNEEQEQIKAEMEGYKKMMLHELQESRNENERLRQNLTNMENTAAQFRQSNIGNLEDVEDKGAYEDMAYQIRELSRQLADTSRENVELKKALEKWEQTHKKLVEDEEKYEDMNVKVQRLEKQMKREMERVSTKCQDDIAFARDICNKYAEKVKQNNYLSSVNFDVTDSKPIKSPRAPDIDTDSVTFWVTSNLSITNCYKVSQQTPSSKGEWSELFSFRALLSPSDLFEKPIYVYSCGGSPYWRQYISLSDQPPSPNYKREITFYASANKIPGSIKYFILDIGSGTVLRSMISRKESVEGWKEKNAFFFALKNGNKEPSKNSFRGSGTFNSEMFRSVSDDEVSLSSFTGTDVVKDELAEALKISRENLFEAENKTSDHVDDFVDESESEESAAVDPIPEAKEEKFIGTSSSSFFGSTLPERGEFYPFPDNMLAVSRFNHSQKMAEAQREEMIKVLEEGLIKRGFEADQDFMSNTTFDSKMKNHEKEMNLLEKKYNGFHDKRKRIMKTLDDYVASNPPDQKKKGKIDGGGRAGAGTGAGTGAGGPGGAGGTGVGGAASGGASGGGGGKWRGADTVVKAAVRFSDEVITPTKKRDPPPSNPPPPPTTPANPPPFSSSLNAVTSTPKEPTVQQTRVINSRPRHFEDDEFVVSAEEDDEEESSSWASDDLAPPPAAISRSGTGASNLSMNDFSATPNRPPSSNERNVVTRLSLDNDEDSSQWDSEKLSARHLQDSHDNETPMSTLEEFDDPPEIYNPKMRPPTGENVRELAASLELSLGSRDSTKKPPGGLDLYQGGP